MIYGYIRVSTDKQQVDNQFFEIRKFAKDKKLKIDRWVEETISSRQSLSQRKLGGLLGKLQKGDILITCELSRLGRNLLQVMGILNHCLTRECQVWTIKEDYRLGADIQSKVLAFAFGLSAEIERNLISQRTKEALARIKSEGKKLGRPFGKSVKPHNFRTLQAQIEYLLREHNSKTEVARCLRISTSTLYRYMEAYNIKHNDYYQYPPMKQVFYFRGRINPADDFRN